MEEFDDPIDLPPGFRFHPTDEELITHYLCPKIVDRGFTSRVIGDVDLNRVEPWDLPWKAKMGEKEWYFFCVRDRKYPNGSRTNRATTAGYWKATGKDKEIFQGKALVGMKKTLVFYTGRAPSGIKSNWVMHEYRVEGKGFVSRNHPKSAKEEWVICRVFNKSPEGKKERVALESEVVRSPELPSLMEVSTDNNVVVREKLYGGFEHDSKENVRRKDDVLLEDLCPAMGMGFKQFEELEFAMGGTVSVNLDCLWDY